MDKNTYYIALAWGLSTAVWVFLYAQALWWRHREINRELTTDHQAPPRYQISEHPPGQIAPGKHPQP